MTQFKQIFADMLTLVSLVFHFKNGARVKEIIK